MQSWLLNTSYKDHVKNETINAIITCSIAENKDVVTNVKEKNSNGFDISTEEHRLHRIRRRWGGRKASSTEEKFASNMKQWTGLGLGRSGQANHYGIVLDQPKTESYGRMPLPHPPDRGLNDLWGQGIEREREREFTGLYGAELRL